MMKLCVMRGQKLRRAWLEYCQAFVKFVITLGHEVCNTLLSRVDLKCHVEELQRDGNTPKNKNNK